MMRRIAIVTDYADSSLGKFLESNLAEVFSGFAATFVYSFEKLQDGDVVEADAVLAMLPAKALELRRYIKDNRAVVVIQRTLREEAVFRLLEIPKGSKVLVVNDTQETTLETVSLLYRLGFDHLELVPYLDNCSLAEVNIAITPGESEKVPQGIAKIIDLGHRCLDLSTILQIMNRLGVEDREIDKRLIQYGENIVTLDGGIKKSYKDLYLKKVALDTVVDLSTEGVLFLDRAGKVLLCNKSLQKMLGFFLPDEKFSDAVLPPQVQDLLQQVKGKDEILQHHGRSLIVNRECVQYFGEMAGTYFKFQEVTYIKQLEESLSRRLQEKGLQARYDFTDILTKSGKVEKILQRAAMMAASDLTVLITGESGTGKELLAQSIHNHSPRAKQPFVALNCAAMPEALLESELFGYEAGAFTGASKDGKAGLFEQANNGTVFLDEIGDMPHTLQARLLRVLQERQVMRIGSHRLINVNIRVVAATNRDLKQNLAAGEFRSDLYYRLNVLPLMMPPLRERKEDIMILFSHFLQQHGRSDLIISKVAADRLCSYEWPGNIRELANAAAYLSFLPGQNVEEFDLPHYITAEIFDDERARLGDRYGAAVAALEILQDLQKTNHGAGRKQLEELLKERKIFLPEGEVRRLLKLLAEAGLIVSCVGRGGSKITEKGKLFLTGKITGK